MRSRSVMVLMMATITRRSPAAGARVARMRLHSSSMAISMLFTWGSSWATDSPSELLPSPSAVIALCRCCSTKPPIPSTLLRTRSRSSLKRREMWWLRSAVSMRVLRPGSRSPRAAPGAIIAELPPAGCMTAVTASSDRRAWPRAGAARARGSRRVGEQGDAPPALRRRRMRPAQQRQLAAPALEERRAALHPVAGVGVERAGDMPQVGAVNVSAHHAVVAIVARMGRGELLELLDVAQAGADAQLQVLGERPVGSAERTAHVVHGMAEAHHRPVQHIAELRQPARTGHALVELVAVHHQQSLAARGAMHPLAMHLELALQHVRQQREAPTRGA